MIRVALCSVFLLTFFNSMVNVTTLPKKRNFKDMMLQEIDIFKMGEEVHSSSNFEVKTMKGGKTKGVGTLKITKDLPPTTTIQWKLFYWNDDNQLVKQAEGKRATICDFMVKEKVMADMMLNDSNVTSCIINKGVYVFRKCTVNMDVFPSKIPENRDMWALDVIFAVGKRVVLYLKATAKIIRD